MCPSSTSISLPPSYGKSLPFPNNASLRGEDHLRYLTVEQALGDYAALIQHLRGSTHPRAMRRVVTFGGSYGGMLSLWMRARYPDLVYAALGSSAPVHFDRVGPSFFKLVTDAATMVPSCPDRVRAGFAALAVESDPAVEDAFGLCPSLGGGGGEEVAAPLDRELLGLWARNAIVTTAMGNYPYAQDLFGKGLQAWPLRVVCEALESSHARGEGGLAGLAAATSTYYNATGRVACHNMAAEYRDCSDQTGCGDAASAWGAAWDVEACTQIVYYTSTNNETDMFPPRQWGLAQLQRYCGPSRAKQGRTPLVPRPEWYRPLLDSILKNGSRMIVTNGGIDPWRGGGIIVGNATRKIVALDTGGAHIEDLAADHVNDTAAMRGARVQIRETLQEWLALPV